ncbi:MAG: tryptophan synthase subunit alpha [Candidatus Thermoplasmatota archaeon]|nr:tryptophan synthase subunit alpha [Candidatus Thermoplasmatota archaeon]
MKLAVYLTAGYPSNEVFGAFASAACTAGADRLEIGLPVREPKYDGPEIRRTHARALENFSMGGLASTLKACINGGTEATALRYMPDPAEFGSILGDIRESGIRQMIIPDLLIDHYEERFAVIEQMNGAGIEWIPFYNPATPDSVILETIDRAGKWVYYGLLPSTGISVPTSVETVYQRAREVIGNREIVFGFGIRDSQQVSLLRDLGADGIAIGSALVNFLQNSDIEGFRNYLGVLNAIRN